MLHFHEGSATKLRKAGYSSLPVSANGLVCMGLSDRCGPADGAESIGMIHRALDRGINFLDTAAIMPTE
jgi:aryl-alcohol dehydrogenase-like predicted oxidoreductase